MQQHAAWREGRRRLRRRLRCRLCHRLGVRAAAAAAAAAAATVVIVAIAVLDGVLVLCGGTGANNCAGRCALALEGPSERRSLLDSKASRRRAAAFGAARIVAPIVAVGRAGTARHGVP